MSSVRKHPHVTRDAVPAPSACNLRVARRKPQLSGTNQFAEAVALSTQTKRNRKRSLVWNIGCWNVRSLLDEEGDLQTARKQGQSTILRKVRFLVQELKRYNIAVTGISETKWFGNDIYDLGSHTIKHADREVPNVSESCNRGEGVGMVLAHTGLDAWNRRGKQYKQ